MTDLLRVVPTRNGGGGTPTPMAATTFEPDAEQHARQLLEQAARYIRAALDVPEDVQTLRTLVSTLWLELAMLRSQVEDLERKVGGRP
jgi:hypothetical protein